MRIHIINYGTVENANDNAIDLPEEDDDVIAPAAQPDYAAEEGIVCGIVLAVFLAVRLWVGY